MTRYRFYLPPRSKLPQIAGICAALLCLNTIYTLISMPNYTQYLDYWATMAGSFLLSIFSFTLIRRRIELILLPTAILALIACLTPNFIHWMEVALFFLFLLLLLLRLPYWGGTCIRISSILVCAAGSFAVLSPMFQRIAMLQQHGNAAADFIVPYVIRTLGGDTLCLLSMVFLIFAMRPQVLPGWMDEHDRYDRIWE